MLYYFELVWTRGNEERGGGGCTGVGGGWIGGRYEGGLGREGAFFCFVFCFYLKRGVGGWGRRQVYGWHGGRGGCRVIF